MKDIFIDANVAKNFAKPKDDQYKNLMRWILSFDESDLQSNGYLVVSQRLIVEYIDGCRGSYSLTSIAAIVDVLTRQKG